MPNSRTIKATVPNREQVFVSPTQLPKPFMKWAGGKRQLIPELIRRMPAFKGRYFEPFLGGGALFFFMQPKRAVIQDSNEELMHAYKVVRDDPDALIAQLSGLKFTEEDYYRIRDEDPVALEPIRRAARTIYLNQTGFNGLYRVNRKGKFNVPMGRYTNPRICHEENLRACAKALAHADISAASYETVLEKVKKGDFVYMDPPYIPVSKTAFFTSYQRGGFSMDDQAALAQLFHKLTEKGVYAMLSNADVEWMHENYAGYVIHQVNAIRRVNCKADDRGLVSEVIVTNY